MGRDKFLKGALILTIAGFLVKVLGSVNRIILSRLLGGEGIGLYQMAYPIYLLMLAVSSAGIPVAISIIVAEKAAKSDYGQVQRILKITLVFMSLFGLVSAAGLYFLADILVGCGFIRDPRAYYAVAVLAPAVFFSSILASFRGYFQGQQMMTPPAVSQILEQLVRVVTMVLLAYMLLPYGLEYAAAGAAFGAVPGGFTGLLVLSWFYYRNRAGRKEKDSLPYLQEREESAAAIVKRLILLAIPVTCANMMLPVTGSIDMLLVPNALGRAGYGVAEATSLFGYLAGMAQPLVLLATIPTLSLAASLVPAISEAYTLRQEEVIRQKTASAFKICMLLVLPAAVGMWALAEPISCTLYATASAAPVISHLAPSAALLGIFQVTTGALQGIGRTAIPMWNMLVGVLVNSAAVWWLTSMPSLHILGAAWGSNLNLLVVVLINLFFLCRNRIGFPAKDSAKIAIASLLMGLAGYGCVHLLTGKIAMVAVLAAGIAVSVLVYGAAVLLLGCITWQEAGQLPLLGRLLRRFKG